MIIAGEPSGELLAAELVDALKQSPQLRELAFPPVFFGAGGPRMAGAGVELAVDMTGHSIIGFFEVLQKYRDFKRIFDRLFQLALDRRPDVIVCVDFSGFNRRFARAIKRHVRAHRGSFNNWDPKIVQYVSPQVWASRPGRARSLERDLDLLLSIIPFEKGWYATRAPKLRVEFVGHPIVGRHRKTDDERPEAAGDRASPPVILLLPGSRAGELKRHLPVMIGAARRIAAAQKVEFRMVLPSESLRSLAQSFVSALPDLEINVGGLASALQQATVTIASTGTVTLECAYFGAPTVTLYKTSWSTYLVARPMITVKYAAMPNLLADDVIYPEFIQGAATAENVARATLDLLNHPDRRMAMKTKLADAVRSLGEPAAAARAAQAILNLLREKTPAPPGRPDL
jgi:lipid-A-disaccharide synthase